MNTLKRSCLILTTSVFLAGCNEFPDDSIQHRETVIIPSGTYFLKPNISDGECTSRDLDFIERTPDKYNADSAILEPIAFITYEGVLHRFINCPHDQDGVKLEEIALVELDDGRLVWVDTKKILPDPSHEGSP